MRWKMLGLAHLACLAVTLSACSNGAKTPDTPRAYRVGVLQFIRHPALDATEKGLEDSLRMLGPAGEIQFDVQVADGNAQRAGSAAEQLVQRKVDVIVAIGTPAAQAVASIPSQIPLVYGAVSDPAGARIIPSQRATGIKNVGPSIIRRALEHMRLLFPLAKRIGTVYNPSEQNSVYVQGLLNVIADSLGFSVVQGMARQPSQVGPAVEALVGRVDVIYSANDNTFNAAISAAVRAADARKVPVVLGDLSTLQAGAVAAVGLDYYQMGKSLAGIVVALREGKSISAIPPSGPPSPGFWINLPKLRSLGIAVPDSTLRLADSLLHEE